MNFVNCIIIMTVVLAAEGSRRFSKKSEGKFGRNSIENILNRDCRYVIVCSIGNPN